MEPIPLKECTYECDSTELGLVDYKRKPENLKNSGLEELMEEYRVECGKCSKEFTIRLESRLVDGERMDTKVSIIDDAGRNLGWLGSY
ncbi:hypothetical protein EU546_08535 [Candidatus Thorarchaeota archaeon]|nr:MAG: hypothetical protein EU546_08535 [Candidatus Thorarchaeota archaeon]